LPVVGVLVVADNFGFFLPNGQLTVGARRRGASVDDLFGPGDGELWRTDAVDGYLSSPAVRLGEEEFLRNKFRSLTLKLRRLALRCEPLTVSSLDIGARRVTIGEGFCLVNTVEDIFVVK
jgi:hypothetical protein